MTKADIIRTRMGNLFRKMEEQKAILKELKMQYDETGDEGLKEFAASALSLRDIYMGEYRDAMEELAREGGC